MMYSHYLAKQHNAICWIKTSSLGQLWMSLARGLLWASKHMLPSNDSSERSQFVHKASLACLLASYCSGWFSRPNDNHHGWRKAFKCIQEGRCKQSAYFLLKKIIMVDQSENLQTQQLLGDTVLKYMLASDFYSIQHLANPAFPEVKQSIPEG